MMIFHDVIYQKIDTLFDERPVRAGTKFNDMDLIGLPFQVIVGNQTATSGMVEVKNRRTDERQNLSIDECLNFLTKECSPYV